MEEILVFKTDASQEADLEKLSSELQKRNGVKKWNFDFDDCDNIFRLVSNGISSNEVVKLLEEHSITATELVD